MSELAKVVWTDAWFDLESGDTMAEEFVVETVGWILRSGPVISVAGERLADGWRAVTHIPASLVRTITELGPVVR